MRKRKKTERPHVIVKCAGCGKTKKIYEGDVAADDFPMCDECYMPMLPQKVVAK